jgi:cyclopropane fatty-acyl-phospholipid synthase-like methyltransferase
MAIMRSPDILSLAVVAVALLLALSLLAFQLITGVPPMSASAGEAADVVALLKQASLPEEAVVYELGCGWGTLVVALARAFPNARIRGIELSPLPYWIARLRTRKMPNVVLRRSDFYAADLQDADAVTCYLMMQRMPKVASFLDKSLQPGTAVVALTFWFRGRRVAAVRNGSGPGREAALYFWPAHEIDTPR